jgi:hypothetical protein
MIPSLLCIALMNEVLTSMDNYPTLGKPPGDALALGCLTGIHGIAPVRGLLTVWPRSVGIRYGLYRLDECFGNQPDFPVSPPTIRRCERAADLFETNVRAFMYIS